MYLVVRTIPCFGCCEALLRGVCWWRLRWQSRPRRTRRTISHFVTDPTGTGVINLLGINNSGTIAGFDNGVTNAGFTLTLPSSFTIGELSGRRVDPGDRHQRRRRSVRLLRRRRSATTMASPTSAARSRPSTILQHGLQPGARHQQFGRDRRLLRADRSRNSGRRRLFADERRVHAHHAWLPANFNSQAVGINSAATPWIVGFYQPDAGLTTSFGFLDEGGTITTIDPFGSTFTQALGVNDAGRDRRLLRRRAVVTSTATSTMAASSPVSTRRAQPRRRSTVSTTRATSSASTPTQRQTPLMGSSERRCRSLRPGR